MLTGEKKSMKKRVCDYCDTIIDDKNFDTISIDGEFKFVKGKREMIYRHGDTHFCNTEHMCCWLTDRILGKE